MVKDLFALSSYQFPLPEELIAQQPCTPRDHSRLMVVERATGQISEIPFYAIKDFLQAGDKLLFNDTKVIPARLFGNKESGAKIEILLIRKFVDDTWEALARPGKKLQPGAIVKISEILSCEILETFSTGNKKIKIHYQGNFEDLLNLHGQMPLPPYIKRAVPDKRDLENYQTIYASSPGAVAAPTAGLHFTKELLAQLTQKGVEQIRLTLHVGLGTFKPVQSEDIRQHNIHSEQLVISEEASQALNKGKAGRLICVGTTSCRALESMSNAEGIVTAGCCDTSIFLYPGYQFKRVDALLTNFHLPGSSLLMLVSAFAGYDLMMEAYAKAIKERYRFFSYGDAMLIL